MPPLWKTLPSLDALNAMNPGTIHEALGIRFTAVGDDYLEATMPVDARTKQPFGLLHGGASAVLAESLGSVASNLASGGGMCAGVEINANHLRAVKDGFVTGRATAVRIGRSLHVWDIRICGPDGELSCVSRLTVMVTERKQAVSS